MNVDATDAELAALMVLGSTCAFDLLFARYRGPVRRVGMSIMRAPDAADDLVQETFLRVWRYRARYSPARGPVRPWVLAIARNLAITEIRRQHCRQDLLDAAREAARMIDHSPDCLAQAIERDESERLRAAVALIPEDQRRALQLSYWGGLTHDQVAARTGAPLGTVKSRIRLGRAKVVRLFDPVDAGPPPVVTVEA